MNVVAVLVVDENLGKLQLVDVRIIRVAGRPSIVRSLSVVCRMNHLVLLSCRVSSGAPQMQPTPSADATSATRTVSPQAQADRQPWAILVLLCVAQFMVVLEITVVSVALPSIGLDLGFSRADLQWVITAYALFAGGLLLLGGRRRPPSGVVASS